MRNWWHVFCVKNKMSYPRLCQLLKLKAQTLTYDLEIINSTFKEQCQNSNLPSCFKQEIKFVNKSTLLKLSTDQSVTLDLIRSNKCS